MTTKIYNLDKTNIKDGVQCIKKLWFNFHEPIKIRDNAEFHKGDRFGLIVRKNYGNGLDLSDNFNIKDVVSKTKEALKSKNFNVIYEGAFIFENTLVRTDVLIKNKDGWDLLEAKATTKIEEKKGILKKEYLLDLSIQTFILKKSGVNLKNIKLIYINKEFIYNGDNKYTDLILEEIMTDVISLEEKEVPNYIKTLEPLINKKTTSPNIEMGSHCEKPHKCSYEKNCKTLLPKTDIVPYTILPYVSQNKEITKYFKDKKSIDPRDPNGIYFRNLADDLKQTQQFAVGLQLIVSFVGLGTLIAGIIGISNIMVFVVKERTKELGIRKALGATPKSVIQMILQESVFITTISGYAGLILGVFLLKNIGLKLEDYFIKNPYIDLSTAISATIILIIFGAIAGYIPAKRAASIKPIIALRDE